MNFQVLLMGIVAYIGLFTAIFFLATVFENLSAYMKRVVLQKYGLQTVILTYLIQNLKKLTIEQLKLPVRGLFQFLHPA